MLVLFLAALDALTAQHIPTVAWIGLLIVSGCLSLWFCRADIVWVWRRILGEQGRHFSADAEPVRFNMFVSEAVGTTSPPSVQNRIILAVKSKTFIFWTACIAVAVLVIVVYWAHFRQGPMNDKLQTNIACDYTEHLRRINWAMEENDIQHFEQEIRQLYPTLEECGLKVPMIDPVSIGEEQYDSTWFGFHEIFLKVLRRLIRNDDLDPDQWNRDVMREPLAKL